MIHQGRDNANDIKRPAEEWQGRLGYEVLDADGWRNAGVHWETPITRNQYEHLAIDSTVRLVMPMHMREESN